MKGWVVSYPKCIENHWERAIKKLWESGKQNAVPTSRNYLSFLFFFRPPLGTISSKKINEFELAVAPHRGECWPANYC
jgi:hypothetical protein